MKKVYLIIITLVLFGAPINMMAEAAREAIEVTMSGITLIVNGNNFRVVGANNEVMEIFNLTGTKVSTIRIDSADKSFALNLPKGCYLVKIGKIVRKISIQ